ncbi:MAG: CinA family protein [Verrucomicrobia bacterium]|nr:CinA family protein [Verrucomicrobiota bacterium]
MSLELKELMLRTPRLTLAVVESMTCGWLQARIGAVSGASEFFLGGLTAYELEQKVRHLGVDRAHAAAVNAVSLAVAEQMAIGGCTFFKSDLVLSTTGYAEAWPEQKVAEPFAFWALAQVRPAGAVIVQSGRIECAGANRVQAQQRVADVVLSELVTYLGKLRE